MGGVDWYHASSALSSGLLCAFVAWGLIGSWRTRRRLACLLAAAGAISAWAMVGHLALALGMGRPRDATPFGAAYLVAPFIITVVFIGAYRASRKAGRHNSAPPDSGR